MKLNSTLMLVAMVLLTLLTGHSYSQSWLIGGNTVATGNTANDIGSLNSRNVDLITNGIVRMRIESDGDIGIGTTTPAEKLHVAGSVQLDGSLFLSDDLYLDGQRFLTIGTNIENTFVGTSAGNSNTAPKNAAFGYQSLFSNTTGDANVAIGTKSLHTNIDGQANTATGYRTLHYNTTGDHNTALGYRALYYSTTSSYNTAFGSEALYLNQTGYDNTANGRRALYSNTAGYFNSAIGCSALYSNTTGYGNTANGNYALYNNITGGTNTASGYSAGSATGDDDYNCSFFGYDADHSSFNDFINSMALGNTSRINADNQVRIGNTNITSIGGYVAWTNLSDGRYKKEVKENVPGLEFINKLRPLTYHLDVSGIRNFLREDFTGEEDKDGYSERSAEAKALDDKAVKEKEQITYTGFIAQDVEKAAQEAGYDFSGIDKPQNEHSLYGLRYAEFVVPLVKAVQELDENQKSEVRSLKSELEELKNQNENLKSEVGSLKSEIESLKALITSDVSLQGGKEMLSGGEERAFLGQNIPNPFNNSTIIPFSIPQNCNEASIAITESATGRVVRTIAVSWHETHLTIDAGALAAGSYSYSLFVDGRMIGTNEMVLTK